MLKEKMNQEQIMALLDQLYLQAVKGIDTVSPPIDVLAKSYLVKSPDTEQAARSFIRYQIAKCTTSGFLTGLGGILSLPLEIPANVATVMYVQMRMIAALAYMGGYDIRSEPVRTLEYACLADISVDEVFKHAGIKTGNRVALTMVEKIPGELLWRINERVGFRLITKFETKSLITLGKAVPVVGGVIGGGFDFVGTRKMAKRAYMMFIQKDAAALSAEEEEN